MATWRASSAPWKWGHGWGNFYELKGCITPNKEPQGLRFAIHDVEAWAGTTSAGP